MEGRLGGVLSIPPEEESAAETRSDNHSPHSPETLVERRQRKSGARLRPVRRKA